MTDDMLVGMSPEYRRPIHPFLLYPLGYNKEATS